MCLVAIEKITYIGHTSIEDMRGGRLKVPINDEYILKAMPPLVVMGLSTNITHGQPPYLPL